VSGAGSLLVGLTGPIGAGKSEVARLFAAHGAVVVDADVVAREVVEPGTPGLAAVADAFGSAVIRPEGTLDREALAAVVFADDARRRTLNDIVHPLVRARMAELSMAAPAGSVVIHDVPLLVESGLVAVYPVIVVVDASERTRVARLVATRGMTEAQALARSAAQADRAERLAVADHVIANDGDLGALRDQVARVWSALRDRRRGGRTEAGEAG
jgi:dephospho-CoA kinase